MSKKQDKGVIGAEKEPEGEPKPAPQVSRETAEPARESKAVLDHRARLAEVDRVRGS